MTLRKLLIGPIPNLKVINTYIEMCLSVVWIYLEPQSPLSDPQALIKHYLL